MSLMVIIDFNLNVQASLICSTVVQVSDFILRRLEIAHTCSQMNTARPSLL